MKTLGEVLAILLIFFLFWGEPDAWDVLHAKVMGTTVQHPQPVAKPEPKRGAFDF